MKKDFTKTYDLNKVEEADGIMDICHNLVHEVMTNNDYFIRSINGYVNTLNQIVFDCTLRDQDQNILLRMNDKVLEVKFINCEEEEIEEIEEKFDNYIEEQLCFWDEDSVFTIDKEK